MSFLLRPGILTNHLVMLLVHAAIFMANISIQFLFNLGNSRSLANFHFLVIFLPCFWTVAVAMQLQSWKDQREYHLAWIWAGGFLLLLFFVPLLVARSSNVAGSNSTVEFFVLLVGTIQFCLCWQIAGNLAKGMAMRLLFTVGAIFWPYFLIAFSIPLRAALEKYAESSRRNG